MTTVGILGAGQAGSTHARAVLGAGYDVVIANSRAPRTLEDLVRSLGAGARAAWATEAAEAADFAMPAARLANALSWAAVGLVALAGVAIGATGAGGDIDFTAALLGGSALAALAVVLSLAVAVTRGRTTQPATAEAAQAPDERTPHPARLVVRPHHRTKEQSSDLPRRSHVRPPRRHPRGGAGSPRTYGGGRQPGHLRTAGSVRARCRR